MSTTKKPTSEIRESEIEEYLKKRVKEAGGEIRKAQWVGRRGAPDRVVFLNGVHFCELKRPKNGKLAAHQVREHERLRANGANVRVLWTHEQVDFFMRVAML